MLWRKCEVGRVSHAANQVGGVRFDLSQEQKEMIHNTVKEFNKACGGLVGCA